jgi:hypothetical protein
VLQNIHYSLILVASQNPTTLSQSAIASLDTYLKTLPDQVAGYKPSLGVASTARLFGWDGGKTHALSDDVKFDQSQATCNW